MDLNGFGVTGTTALLLTFFVMGFVEMIKAIFVKDWKTATIILTAGLSGFLAAPMLGLNIMTGICGGLAASGVLTMVKKSKKD